MMMHTKKTHQRSQWAYSRTYSKAMINITALGQYMCQAVRDLNSDQVKSILASGEMTATIINQPFQSGSQTYPALLHVVSIGTRDAQQVEKQLEIVRSLLHAHAN